MLKESCLPAAEKRGFIPLTGAGTSDTAVCHRVHRPRTGAGARAGTQPDEIVAIEPEWACRRFRLGVPTRLHRSVAP